MNRLNQSVLLSPGVRPSPSMLPVRPLNLKNPLYCMVSFRFCVRLRSTSRMYPVVLGDAVSRLPDGAVTA